MGHPGIEWAPPVGLPIDAGQGTRMEKCSARGPGVKICRVGPRRSNREYLPSEDGEETRRFAQIRRIRKNGNPILPATKQPRTLSDFGSKSAMLSTGWDHRFISKSLITTALLTRRPWRDIDRKLVGAGRRNWQGAINHCVSFCSS